MYGYKLAKGSFTSKKGEKYPIIYIQGNTFDYRDILKKYNAKFDGNTKQWYWFVNEDVNKTIQTNIKPALLELNEALKSASNEISINIDDVLNAIAEEKPSTNPAINLSKEDEDNLKNKLLKFKEMLTNIENDEEFKNVMGQIVTMKAAQGYSFSLFNALLIYIQNMKAGVVNSASNWRDKYNRTLKPGAQPIMVYAPQGSAINKSKKEKDDIQSRFYKEVGKYKYEELTPNEKIRLDKLLKPFIMASRYKLVPVYSQHDTVQAEGSEDYIEAAEKAKKDIKWYDDEVESDAVIPVYNGLLKFASENDISVEDVEDLDGARGVSMSGKIKVLKNKGNSIGMTKTLAHEVSHELLHQAYLKNKGKESGKFKIETPITRDMVEQQAELSAWMFMYAFGFDVKTTSLNYTVLWGGRKDNMVLVFDTVSGVVNHLVNFVNKNMATTEAQGSPEHGKMITPEDIVHILGVEKEYREAQTKTEMYERLNIKMKNLIK